MRRWFDRFSLTHVRALSLVALIAALVAGTSIAGLGTLAAVPASRLVDLPARLTNQEFWQLSQSFSEPGGTFHSDNFVSNEGKFQTVIPDLLRRVKPGGFYVGVGPEQNFTYVAAVRPRMAFIVDIRRGNLLEHLLYKALFEMSADRSDFVSRLFSRARPAGLASTSSIESIFEAIARSPATETRYAANLKAVIDHLSGVRGLPLNAEDRDGIDYVYRNAFFTDGPSLNYQLLGQVGRGRGRGVGSPSYAELMAMDDGAGQQRGFLASEESFLFIKSLQASNLIVPVVGDFAGPKALRSVGRYAREHGVTVAAFYLSNVEQYLRPAGTWDGFCGNVATMPTDAASTFIRSVRGGGGIGGALFTSSLESIQSATRACAPRAAAVRAPALAGR